MASDLADMIGLDILLNVMNVMDKEIGAKYHPSLLLRKMVTAGFLVLIYGAYFLATCFGARRIVKGNG